MIKPESPITRKIKDAKTYVKNPKKGKAMEKRGEIPLCADDDYNATLPLFSICVTSSFLREDGGLFHIR